MSIKKLSLAERPPIISGVDRGGVLAADRGETTDWRQIAQLYRVLVQLDASPVIEMNLMQKIVTFLWFDKEAEEAANYYVGIFPDSRIVECHRTDYEGHGAGGVVTVVKFELAGQEFLALNGGPMFKFTPAISLFVNCKTQAEVDELWETLSEGGEKGHCGWLTDKFGLSWQIVPTALGELMSTGDAATAKKVMDVLLQMRKLDGDALRAAAEA